MFPISFVLETLQSQIVYYYLSFKTKNAHVSKTFKRNALSPRQFVKMGLRRQTILLQSLINKKFVTIFYVDCRSNENNLLLHESK